MCLALTKAAEQRREIPLLYAWGHAQKAVTKVTKVSKDIEATTDTRDTKGIRVIRVTLFTEVTKATKVWTDTRDTKGIKVFRVTKELTARAARHAKRLLAILLATVCQQKEAGKMWAARLRLILIMGMIAGPKGKQYA